MVASLSVRICPSWLGDLPCHFVFAALLALHYVDHDFYPKVVSHRQDVSDTEVTQLGPSGWRAVSSMSLKTCRLRQRPRHEYAFP
jgi:hypothetical protein